MIELDKKVKNVLDTYGDKITEKTVLKAIQYQAIYNIDIAKKIKSEFIKSKENINAANKIIDSLEIANKSANEKKENEKWLFILTINSDNQISESNIKEFKLNQKYSEIKEGNIFTLNTDVNVRNNKPIIFEYQYEKGEVIDVKKENSKIEIKQTAIIDGIDNQKFVWVMIQ